MRRLLAALAALLWATAAQAQTAPVTGPVPLVSGPFDVSQFNSKVNGVIQAINSCFNGTGVGNCFATGSIFGSQPANEVFAAPPLGSGLPAFRLLSGFDMPNPGFTSLGGVQAVATVSHQWLDSISVAGVPHLSQPAYGDISGSVPSTAMPALSGVVTTSAGSTVTSYASSTGSGAAVLATSPVVATPTITGLTSGLGTGFLCINLGSGVVSAPGTPCVGSTGTGTTTVLSASPVLTGTPTAPTPATSDFSTTLATTAFAGNLSGRANPSNLFIAVSGSGGSDANDCLAATVGGGHGPCLTPQHVADVAMAYQLQGATLTVNVGAGTFNNGAALGGAPRGGAGANTGGGSIVWNGTGLSTTVINNTDTTQCSNGLGSPFTVTAGGNITISNMELTTNCAGGSGVWAQGGGTATIGCGVELFSAPIAGLKADNFSSIFVNGGCDLTIGGGGDFAFEAESGLIRFFGSGSDHIVVSGTPTYSVAVFDGINGAQLKTGGRNFTNGGNATGQRYALATNSSIDNEQNTADLPGTIQGALSGSSTYNLEVAPCIGGNTTTGTHWGGAAGSCGTSTAPTGLGAGGTAAVTGDDYSGTITLSPSGSPAATGILFLSLYSSMAGCVATPALGGTGAWEPSSGAAPADAQSVYGVFAGNTGFSNGLEIKWNNSGAALIAGSTYKIGYICH